MTIVMLLLALRRGDAARDLGRSALRLHSSGHIPFADGPRRRLQPHEAARRRLRHRGQILVGALGGVICGLLLGDEIARQTLARDRPILILLPLIAVSAMLWPVLGTSYRGFPIGSATPSLCGGLVFAFICFERAFVLMFRFLTRSRRVN